MWLLIVLIIIGAALGAYFVFLQTRKIEEPPDTPDTYVCDVCGEHECICHKEDPAESA
jgi:hypothetical protein